MRTTLSRALGSVPLAITLFGVATLAGALYVLAPVAATPQRASPLPISSPATERPVRVAMSAAFVSEEGVPSYAELVDYLTEKSGRRHELITGLSYTSINQMLAAGAVDYGFICGYPYVLARDKPVPDVEVLVGPVMKASRYRGQPIYFSDLIVHPRSPFQSLRDLRGRTFVYNEETSNSGYNMPRSHLAELGLTGGFFGKVLRSGSHEESIRMVAKGLADASYVDSLVLDYDREQNGHGARVRVIESLGPAPVVPLVASTRTDVEDRERLRRLLLTMHKDERGRQILDQLLVDRFVVVTDEHYDPVRAMEKRARDAGFMVIR